MLKERFSASNRGTNYTISQKNSQAKLFQTSKQLSTQSPFQSEITIKLIGDLKENIHDIVSRLRCSQSCQVSIEYILNQYGKKIQKLREQRNFFREMLLIKQEQSKRKTNELKMKIVRLQEELVQKSKQTSICERCTCQDEQDIFGSKYSQTLRQCCLDEVGSSTNRFRDEYLPKPSCYCEIDKENQCQPNLEEQFSEIPIDEPSSQKLNSKEEELLIQNESEPSSILKERIMNEIQAKNSINILFDTQKQKTISEEDLMRLMLKYNFSLQDLENVLDDYENENKMADEMFDSQQQRNLYRLGQKMQKDIWNKKVMHDVKRLSLIKGQTHNSSNCQPNR